MLWCGGDWEPWPWAALEGSEQVEIKWELSLRCTFRHPNHANPYLKTLTWFFIELWWSSKFLLKNMAHRNIYSLAPAYLSSLISFHVSHLPPPLASVSSSCTEFLSVLWTLQSLFDYSTRLSKINTSSLSPARPLASQRIFGSLDVIFSRKCSQPSHASPWLVSMFPQYPENPCYNTCVFVKKKKKKF